MTRWLRRLMRGASLPEGFGCALAGDERLLTSAPVGDGGHLVVTTLGLWVPASAAEGGHRRIGWHLVSKATWDGRAMTVVEADEIGTDGNAVVIAERPPLRLVLPEPRNVPELVHARVTRSVLHSERNAAGDVVVRRRVPGRDGMLLQVRRSTR